MSEFLHVSLRSRDRDRTSEWYQKNLGFEERRRGTTGIGTQTAILVHPSTKTYIEVSDRVKLGHDFEIPEEAIMLRFTVPDMQAAYDRFKGNGAKITEGDPGSEHIFLEDADGYEVEIGRAEARSGSIPSACGSPTWTRARSSTPRTSASRSKGAGRRRGAPTSPSWSSPAIPPPWPCARCPSSPPRWTSRRT
jgi:catechol 2,3-dioxygenase-like lactoylglutathione lyase family enzyme